MARFSPLTLVFLACAGGSWLPADTLTLASGERVEGRLLSRDAGTIRFEVKVSDNILETRDFPATEVVRVEVTPDWQRAFDALADTAPGNYSLSPTDYARLIEGRLRPYLQAFPNSPRRSEVEARVAELQEEADRVARGELKLDGVWIDAEETARRRADLEAEIVHRSALAAIERRDWIGALNSLRRIEREYPGSRAVPAAVELGRQVLPAFRVELTRMLEIARRARADWEKGVALTPKYRRQTLLDARAREEAAHAARLAEAEKNGLWPAVPSGYITGIEGLIGRADKELERLRAVPVAAMHESLKLTDRAVELLKGSDTAGAEELLKQAETAWKENGAVARLRTAIGEMQTLQDARPATSPSPGTAATPAVAATPAPTPAKLAAPSAEPKPPFYRQPVFIGLVAALVAAVIGSLFVSKRPPRSPTAP